MEAVSNRAAGSWAARVVASARMTTALILLDPGRAPCAVEFPLQLAAPLQLALKLLASDPAITIPIRAPEHLPQSGGAGVLQFVGRDDAVPVHIEAQENRRRLQTGAVRQQFLGSQAPVSISVEFPERSRTVRDLPRGNPAVVIPVEGGEHAVDAHELAARSFRKPRREIRRRRPETALLGAQLAVTIGVEFPQGRRRRDDLPLRDDQVVIGVE